MAGNFVWPVIVAILTFILANFVASDVKVKEYALNLDLAPQDRWINILKDRKDAKEEITEALKSLIQRVPKVFRNPIIKLCSDYDNLLPPTYAAEMKGIAKYLEIDVGDIVLANILYDVTAFCTSIVAQDTGGHIWHGRNLDYDFTKFLRNMTMVVHYQRQGKTVYTATHFLGLIGVLTGQKPGVFTISMDERDSGSFWMNILTALLDRKARHASFFIRDLLEQAQTYEEALNLLNTTDTIAPAYYIIGGTKPGQGAVVTRGRLWALDTWTLNPNSGRWFLVETNYDHWKPPPKGDDRRDPANIFMKAVGQVDIAADTLYKVLSTTPLLRPTTVYTTTMSAAHPKIYTTIERNFKV